MVKFKDLIKYNKDIRTYNRMNKLNETFVYKKKNKRACFDWNSEAGTIDGHYFLQDLYMAKKVLKDNPKRHYDIGSRIDGFIAHLLTNMSVTMIDIRPLEFEVDGLDFMRGNATSLIGIADNSIDSLSCLHALEHFGLGRYGDPIDPDAWRLALNEMQRVLKSGGKLYLSVPIGDNEKLCFNAHRIFSPLTVVNAIPSMNLIQFSFIKDMRIIGGGDVYENNVYGEYACGLFIFEK